jgi:RNA polymerase sigma factor (TIGR02999 family)
MSEVTHILSAIELGDPHAAAQLLPLVYEELRRLAAQKLAQEKPGQTLQATALVHEAYLRLVAGGEDAASREQHWDGRRHFFAAAAEAMRRILIENGRLKKRGKHGGGRQRVELDDAALAIEGPGEDSLAIAEALDELARQDASLADLVKLHYFAGLTLDETAGLLGLSPRTAHRRWAFARAWLYRRLGGTNPATPE